MLLYSSIVDDEFPFRIIYREFLVTGYFHCQDKIYPTAVWAGCSLNYVVSSGTK